MFTTASAVDIHVFTGTIISLPFFKFREFTAISKASVPFATLMQNFEPVYFLKLYSKFLTSEPPIKLELTIIFLIFEKIFFFIWC